MSGDNDLRYIKVEEALRSAMLDLLANKQLEDVTVSEICKLARCSRNAFYGHYAGRDELCAAMIDDFATTLREACTKENERLHAGGVGSFDFEHALISAFREHEPLLRVLLRADTGVFANTISRTVYETFMGSFERLTGRQPEPSIRLAIAFSAGGAVSITDRWFKEQQDKDVSFESFYTAFHDMLLPVNDAVRNVVVPSSADQGQGPDSSDD
jgi:AcrR family transcriptional regulator